MAYARSLAEVHFSATRRMTRSRVASAKSIRHSVAKNPSVNSPFLAKKWKISYVFIKNFRKKKIISQIICIFTPIIYGNMEVKKLNRLKVVMAEKDLSNTWLSDRLGVSQATVSKWMTNFSQPNLETLIKISKVLNVDLNELVRPDEVQIDEEA